MNHWDYLQSKKLEKTEWPFYSLIMAAMRRADTVNLIKLQAMFPDIWDELDARYNAVGGLLPEERPDGEISPGQDQANQELLEQIAAKREDEEFIDRIRKRVTEDRPILDRLRDEEHFQEEGFAPES